MPGWSHVTGNVQAVSNSLWAYAKLGYNPGRELLDCTARRAGSMLHQYTSQARPLHRHRCVLCAFLLCQMIFDRWLSLLHHAHRRHLHCMQDLCTSVYANSVHA